MALQEWTHEELIYHNQLNLVETLFRFRSDFASYLTSFSSEEKTLFAEYFVPCRQRAENFRAYFAQLRAADARSWRRVNRLLKRFLHKARVPIDEALIGA